MEATCSTIHPSPNWFGFQDLMMRCRPETYKSKHVVHMHVWQTMTNLPQFHFIISSTVLAFLHPSSSAWMLKKKPMKTPVSPLGRLSPHQFYRNIPTISMKHPTRYVEALGFCWCWEVHILPGWYPQVIHDSLWGILTWCHPFSGRHLGYGRSDRSKIWWKSMEILDPFWATQDQKTTVPCIPFGCCIGLWHHQQLSFYDLHPRGNCTKFGTPGELWNTWGLEEEAMRVQSRKVFYTRLAH